MFEDLLKLAQELEKQDELFKTLALVLKKAYDALVEAGFSDDQASSIVAGLARIKS